jgi:mono/diheme cytochrome c family protein
MRSLGWKDLVLCGFASTLLLTIGCSGSPSQGGNATAKRSVAGSVGDQGWYSTDQAAQGEALFKAKCAVCHGANLQALDATSGKQLCSYDTKNAIAGGIITYSAGGKQYVAAAAGNTSFVAWRITGKPTLFIFGM